MPNILLNKKQFDLITQAAEFEVNLKLAEDNWSRFSTEEKQIVLELCKVIYPKNSNLIKEAEWYNLVGDILGIADPTGVVDVVNGISYFSQGDHLFGLLSIISAIPYAGDVVAKPVMASLKIGGGATKGLSAAMKLAKAGKTTEAAASLAKLAESPGIVGKFLQSAKTWAPKVVSKLEKLSGGIFKGFKNTIIDYLKLLENAGAKSVKFQKAAGNLAKNMGRATKPVENIKALQSLLKNEKIATNLTKRSTLSSIFLGGAPRLFGNRNMRILMRRTKWWLGFLDYIGMGNFIGPEELANKMSEQMINQKMNEYNKTPEAKKYAEEDFAGGVFGVEGETSKPSPTNVSQPQEPDFLQNFLKTIFTGQMTGGLTSALK
jgi:hypothetical protein